MKYSFAAVALAAVASAQTIADIPSCARPVLEKSIADNTDCEVSDLACVCKNFDSIQGAATAAILKACGAETALNEVLPAAEALCANPPTESEPEETSAAEEAPVETTAAETTAAAPETTAPAAPSDYPSSTLVEVTTSYPVEEPVETPSEEPTVVVPPAETPSDDGEATPVPTAGAATLGSMGALAMVVIAAFAL